MRKPRKPLPRRTSFIARSTKPIARLNVKRAARKRDAYQAYLRSPEWREKKRLVRERSGGRCERMIPVWFYLPGNRREHIGDLRCANRAAVVNHKRYQRLGDENMEDLEHLCKTHNDEYESARPWRSARRVALARAEGR